MDFYTKDWKNYVYKEWNNLLVKKYYITDIYNICDLPDLTLSLITRKDQYFIDKVFEQGILDCCNDTFEYQKKYEYFEKEFGKYEKIEVVENLSKDDFLDKINIFTQKYKTKLENIINKLKENGIDIDIDINNINFTLLALNKITLETKATYQKIKETYLENIYKFDNLSEEEYNDIDYIENDVNAFLTDYDTYLNSRKDKFDYDLLKKISFHDGVIRNYQKINNNLSFEFIDEWGSDHLIKLTFENVAVSDDKNFEYANIYNCDYGNYEDCNYYMCFEFVGSDYGNINTHEVEFTADKIVIEEFGTNIKEKQTEELINRVGKEVYNFIFSPVSYKYQAASYDYNNEHLKINYINSITKNKECSLDFINSRIKIINNNKEITVKELEKIYLSKSNNYKIDLERFYTRAYPMEINLRDNKIEVRILLFEGEDTVEVFIQCDDIKIIE